MIILMIYYCCVGFSAKAAQSDEKPKCCSLSVGFYITSTTLVIITSLCAFYGAVMLCAPANEDIQKSLENLNTDTLSRDLQNLTQSLPGIQSQLGLIRSEVLAELGSTADRQIFEDQSEKLKQYGKGTFPVINDTSNMAKMNQYISIVEIHRFWWSIGLFALFGLISILSQFGVCFRSKGMLLGMTCVSFFALVLCDLSLSVQLSVGVAISDYCQQPDAARDNFIQMPECDLQSKNVEEVISVANEMERIMSQLIKTKGSQSVNQNWLGYRDSMAGIRSVADSFRELRQCDVIQKEYQKITTSLCSGYIVGWWTVLGSSLLVSIFLTQALMFAPCVWRRYDPELVDSSYPYATDEDVPFMRPATFQQPTYPQTRQSVTLNYLCQSNDDLNFSDNRPPPVSVSI